jgi:Beta xylosidase C-terminal Concanavalin A-like domain
MYRGLIVMGTDYAYISVQKKANGLYSSVSICQDADKEGVERQLEAQQIKSNSFYLRLKVTDGARCEFSYSVDGRSFVAVGEPFTARKGRWIGAKVGIFAIGRGTTNERGYADFDWFRIE